MNILILAAGDGKRFSESGIKTPKPFISIGNMQILDAVVRNIYTQDDQIYIISRIEHKKYMENTDLYDTFVPKENILYLGKVTRGPADTIIKFFDTYDSLFNREFDFQSEFIVINCDQYIFDFNMDSFKTFRSMYRPDGIVGAFKSNKQHNSYIKFGHDNILVKEIVEKVVISDVATNGLHYWRTAFDCYSLIDKMIKANDCVNGEFYIAPSYNYFIKENNRVLAYFFNMHFPLGTVEDVNTFNYMRLWKYIR